MSTPDAPKARREIPNNRTTFHVTMGVKEFDVMLDWKHVRALAHRAARNTTHRSTFGPVTVVSLTNEPDKPVGLDDE